MGNLNETANWDAGVPYFAADAVLTGGPDCPDNIPIQALTNRTAFLKKQIDDAVSGALVTMTAKKLQTARTITMTGDGAWVVSFDGSGNASAAMSLAATGVAAGTYPVVMVDSKGRVTGGRSLTEADVPPVDVSKITGAASQAYVQQAIANLLNGAPGALDTLQELAAALGNDANFAATMTNALAGKAAKATTMAGYGITDGLALSAFTGSNQSLVSNGYQKFPGGLIIQWGGIAAAARATETDFGIQTFPITFPNALLVPMAVIVTGDSAGLSDSFANVYSPTKSGMGVLAGSNVSGSGKTIGINWIAIGF